MLCPCPRAALATVALVLIVAGPVAGHSELKTVLPGPDDVVDVFPAELVATFSQDLDPARSSLELRDGAGTPVARGGRDPSSRRTMRLALPPLTPGS